MREVRLLPLVLVLYGTTMSLAGLDLIGRFTFCPVSFLGPTVS